MSDLNTKEPYLDRSIHNEEHSHVAVSTVDTAAALVSGNEDTLDPKDASRIRALVDRNVLPLMCTLYGMQFMDKITLGSAAILGIRQDTHLTTNQYNMLGTAFYLSFTLFEYPQNLALQRFPVGKWMSLNITIWGIALMCHAACTNFTGLVIVRLILGMCESCSTAGFLIISSMFYTRKEQTQRVGYWLSMNGLAEIVLGFISFGSLHIKTSKFRSWQWLMVITGIMTMITAACFWLFFPDSPTNAWFFSKEDRAKAVLRIRENQTGVENKVFKKEQMIEALTDPKTWLFALFLALFDVPNSLLNQRQIIVNSFGFTQFQTTLLGCVDGIVEIVTIFVGVHVASHFHNAIAYTGMIWIIPNIMGVLLMTLLPWSNHIGLLFAFWMTGIGVTAFVLSLSWLNNVTAGHTKRITSNAIVMSAFGIGNIVGPFMWQSKYYPRNRVPWTIIGICYVLSFLILLVIRILLSRENQRRDREPLDETYDDCYVTRENSDGSEVDVRVSKEFLDLTDKQNRAFRYVL